MTSARTWASHLHALNAKGSSSSRPDGQHEVHDEPPKSISPGDLLDDVSNVIDLDAGAEVVAQEELLELIVRQASLHHVPAEKPDIAVDEQISERIDRARV